MIALYIILSVLLLLFLVSIIPLSLTFIYKDEVVIYARIWKFKIPIYPKKKKKIKLSDYSPRKLERQKKKALRKNAKAKRKALAAKHGQKAAKQKDGGKEKSLMDNLELIAQLLRAYLEHAVKHVKIKTTKIILNIGSDDAAKTALLYAAAKNALLVILTFLDQFKKLKKLHSSNISVNADFLSESCSADIELTFTMRTWHMACALFAAAMKYVTEKSK